MTDTNVVAEAPVSEPKAKAKDAGRLTEESLLAKRPHLIPGSLGWDPVANKQFGLIRCIGEHEDGDESAIRRVFTSDLHQVTMCREHTKAQRRERAKARRAARKAEQSEESSS